MASCLLSSIFTSLHCPCFDSLPCPLFHFAHLLALEQHVASNLKSGWVDTSVNQVIGHSSLCQLLSEALQGMG